MKPFESGICIEENLTSKHRLLFNKFPARNCHVLVITKEPENQGNRLNTTDFMAALVALKTLDEAFMYYNSGPTAGASQNHKHMHVIPVKSLTNNKIPIHDRVMDALQRAQVTSESNNLDGTPGFGTGDLSDTGQENGIGQYNNLSVLGTNMGSRYGGGKGQHQFFILPEF